MCSNDDLGENTNEEEETMNACALKPNSPFITSRKLERTPASKESIDRIKFMDSHDFSFNIDSNEKMNITVTKKK